MSTAERLLGSPLLLRVAAEAHGLAHAARAGLVRAESPRRTLGVVNSVRRYGAFGGAVAIAAVRHGDRPALVDELGTLTFRELDRRSNALANELRERGLGAGDGIGVLCRNHRGFLDITFAGAKLGAKLLYLNTDFAGPQLREVCEREGIELLVHDEEFATVVAGAPAALGHLVAWSDAPVGEAALEALIARGDPAPPPSASGHAKVVLLTSGTTGTPKGAPRPDPKSLAPIGALLSKAPFRREGCTYIAAPFFHALGFAQAVLAVALGSTIVVRRRFKPGDVLEAVERHRCDGLIVVPVMLARLVSCAEQGEFRGDTSSLRIVFVAGSQLDANLAERALDTFGETIHNLYGSTEVAYATIATPADLKAAPGCAGRPPFATTVRLYDAAGQAVSGVGVSGRIFVGNTFQFEGYTGGGNKEVIDGLMSSGDVGHFDAAGRLFVDGRDDEMIVSGGENLFPGEVEELLARHEAIEEAAVIGVDDEQFGKRLAAFVALRPAAELTEDQVKDFVRENLARFKVPRDVTFVQALPRNPTGKVLKRELAQRGS
ncbi:MAG: acyl-CoA synthetase [Solirubrobacteraceae bacterium]